MWMMTVTVVLITHHYYYFLYFNRYKMKINLLMILKVTFQTLELLQLIYTNTKISISQTCISQPFEVVFHDFNCNSKFAIKWY